MKEATRVSQAAFAIAAAAFVALLIVPLFSAPASGSAAARVEIVPGASYLGDKAYSPSPVTVKVGDTVTWVNNDSSPHTVTSGDGWFDRNAAKAFNSRFIFPKHEFSHTFTEPGIYNYFSNIQGQYSMVGQVVVEEAPPQLTLVTQRSSYAAGQTVTVKGEVSVVRNVPVEIQVFNPQGRAYLFDSATIASNGSFAYSFIAPDAQGAGSYRIAASYLGSTAETNFSIVQKPVPASGAAVVSVTAYSHASSPVVYVYLKNVAAGDIYGFSVTLSETIGSAQAPRGWDTKDDGTAVTFSTDDRPVKDGKRVAFRVAAGQSVTNLEWAVYGIAGEEIDGGTAAIRLRR